MIAYVALTWVTFVIDTIEFIIHFIRFGYKGEEHSDIAMLFLTIIFLGLDVYYLVWALGAKDKFSGVISKSLVAALFGRVESISDSLAEVARSKKQSIKKLITRGKKP